MAEMIYGENLEQKKFSQSEIEIARRKLNDFYSSLIDYVRYKYVNGGYYLSDIFSNAQYVYGKRKEEKQDNVYLIDLGTKVGEYKPVADRSYNTDLSRCLWNIFQMIQSAEERLGGTELDTARIKLLNFLNSIASDDPNYSSLIALKDWLVPIE
jgi:hypothetical protein